MSAFPTRRFCLGLLVSVSLATSAALAQAPDRADVLIGFAGPPGAAQQAQVRGLGGRIKYSYTIVPAIAANLPERAIGALLLSPGVTTVERDGRVQAIDAELDNTWGAKRIGSGAAHDAGNTGAGVRVAVIDTGVDYTHPELSGAYVPTCSKDFVNGDDDPMDDHWHGTHTAGTIAAADDGTGVVGVAPGVDLCVYKVLNSAGGGSWSDIIAALQQATLDGVQVTNNSYGSGSNPGSIVQAAFDNSAAAGVLNVAAAGNAGNLAGTGDNIGYPAAYASVMAVAATDQGDNRAYFSSTGSAAEIAAPGVNILSTYLGGGYATANGTSMASPHVAGAAALVIASGVSGPANVRAVLDQTADDLGAAGWDTWYGHGLVDAAEASTTEAPAAPPPEQPPADAPPGVAITSPAAGETVSGTVTIQVDASDDVGVAQVEFLVDGSRVALDTNGKNGWSAKWDTTGVANGDHAVTVEATDSAGQTAMHSVSVTVDNTAGGGGGKKPNPGKGNNK